jgi:hypothetical protein
VIATSSRSTCINWQRSLIRPPPPIGDRLFEIEFLDAGVEAYVFTFGRPRSEDHVSGTDNRSADRRARARRLRG